MTNPAEHSAQSAGMVCASASGIARRDGLTTVASSILFPQVSIAATCGNATQVRPASLICGAWRSDAADRRCASNSRTLWRGWTHASSGAVARFFLLGD